MNNAAVCWNTAQSIKAEAVRVRNVDEVFSGLCHSARRDEVGNEVKEVNVS
jgi:hypothetical protein